MAIEYIHLSIPSLQRDSLLLDVVNSPVFPFIRELNFKYGARVIRKGNNGVYYLAFDGDHPFNSMPFARVYTQEVRNAADKTVTEYCYYTEYTQKERGRNHEDKHTWRGLKLGSLMNSVKKKALVPPANIMLDRMSSAWRDAYSHYSTKLGNTTKPNLLEEDEIQAMLKQILRGETAPINMLDKYKTVLDKWEKVDKITEEKKAELKRFFGSAFYAIGASTRDSSTKLKVGIVRRNSDHQWEILQPFKHISDIEQVPDLIPVLTMFKVKLDDYARKGNDIYGGYVPMVAAHDVDMDIALNYSQYPDEFFYTWMLTPCHLPFPVSA